MPNAPRNTDVRTAQKKADANAEKQAATQTAAMPTPDETQNPATPSHADKLRPADAGWVAGSPEDYERRVGKAGDTATSDAEMVPNEGVPDLPAIKAHNEHFADVAEATANQAQAGGTPGQATMLGTPETGANKENVIEGQVPGPVKDAAADEDKK